MSTKSKTQSSEADPPVNSVVFELYDEYATTSAGHRKGRDEQRLYVRVEGGYLRRIPYGCCDRSYPNLR